MQSKFKAALYIRLSYTDDKSSESDSVQNQRRILQSFTEQNPDIQVVSEKVDDGYSGIIFDRPAFKEMMADIEANIINCVIVKDLSRLGREYIETGRYLRHVFPAYGVRFIAINDHIDTMQDSGDDLVVSVKSVLNDAYCRDISVKTRSALNAKRESGAYVGACPVYGYRKSAENRNQMVPDPYTSGIVRNIYRYKLDGLSAQKIAETLTGLGVLSPAGYKKDRGLPLSSGGFANADGTKWSAKAVLRILSNEIYTGTLIQGKVGTLNYKIKDTVQKSEAEWKRTENAHQAIISKHDFDIVQQLMRLDTRTKPAGDKVHIFSGLLICDCCGGPMTRKTVTVKGTSYYYYYCPTTKKRGCAHAVTMKESDLMDCVLTLIKQQVAHMVSVESLLAGSDKQRAISAIAEQLHTQITDAKSQLLKARAFKASLYEHLISGILSKEDYKDLKTQYSDDEQRLQTALNSLNGQLEDVTSGKSERLAFMEQFRQFQNLAQLDRQTVVRLIQSIRVISKTDLQIVFHYQAEYEYLVNLLKPILKESEEVA